MRTESLSTVLFLILPFHKTEDWAGSGQGPALRAGIQARRAAELTATELCRAAPSASAVTSATSLRCLRTLPSPPACSIRRNAAGPEHEATRADCSRGLAGKG